MGWFPSTAPPDSIYLTGAPGRPPGPAQAQPWHAR